MSLIVGIGVVAGWISLLGLLCLFYCFARYMKKLCRKNHTTPIRAEVVKVQIQKQADDIVVKSVNCEGEDAEGSGRPVMAEVVGGRPVDDSNAAMYPQLEVHKGVVNEVV